MSLPRWLDQNRDRLKKSIKQEQRIADTLGGKRLKRSGGMPWSRFDPTTECGDINSDRFLIEHKMTENRSISVKREWLDKVTKGANAKMKLPALVVTFTEKNAEPEDWILIKLDSFHKLVGRG